MQAAPVRGGIAELAVPDREPGGWRVGSREADFVVEEDAAANRQCSAFQADARADCVCSGRASLNSMFSIENRP